MYIEYVCKSITWFTFDSQCINTWVKISQTFLILNQPCALPKALWKCMFFFFKMNNICYEPKAQEALLIFLFNTNAQRAFIFGSW